MWLMKRTARNFFQDLTYYFNQKSASGRLARQRQQIGSQDRPSKARGSIEKVLYEDWEPRNCSQLNRRVGRAEIHNLDWAALNPFLLFCSVVWVCNNPLNISINGSNMTKMTFHLSQYNEVRRNLLFPDFLLKHTHTCWYVTRVPATESPHTIHIPPEQLLDSKPSVTLAFRAPCKTTNFSPFNFCSFWQLHLFFRGRHEYFRPEWQTRWRM